MAESLDNSELSVFSVQSSVFRLQSHAESGRAARTTAGGTLGTLLALDNQLGLGKQRERLEPAMAGQDEPLRKDVEPITHASRIARFPNPRRREPSMCEQNAPQAFAKGSSSISRGHIKIKYGKRVREPAEGARFSPPRIKTTDAGVFLPSSKKSYLPLRATNSTASTYIAKKTFRAHATPARAGIEPQREAASSRCGLANYATHGRAGCASPGLLNAGGKRR
jgi:hypothetical protein